MSDDTVRGAEYWHEVAQTQARHIADLERQIAALREDHAPRCCAVHLRRIGDHAIVAVEVDGKWRDVIKEHIDGNFSHIWEGNYDAAPIPEDRKQ